jgi:hypothetical protein
VCACVCVCVRACVRLLCATACALTSGGCSSGVVHVNVDGRGLGPPQQQRSEGEYALTAATEHSQQPDRCHTFKPDKNQRWLSEHNAHKTQGVTVRTSFFSSSAPSGSMIRGLEMLLGLWLTEPAVEDNMPTVSVMPSNL